MVETVSHWDDSILPPESIYKGRTIFDPYQLDGGRTKGRSVTIYIYFESEDRAEWLTKRGTAKV